MLPELQSVGFLEMKIYSGNSSSLLGFLQTFRGEEKGIAVHFSAAHGFAKARNNSELQAVFNRGVTVSDGKPLTLYLKNYERKITQIRGTDFMRDSLLNDDVDVAHFFLGSTPNVLESLVKKARQSNPNLRIVGAISPPFTNDWEYIANWSIPFIKQSNPDYIWIGLGAPKQFFVADRLAALHTGAYLSVGAAFNFIAGTERESPRFLTNIGFEWLFRLINNPIKLFARYTIDNASFLLLVAQDVRKRLFG